MFLGAEVTVLYATRHVLDMRQHMPAIAWCKCYVNHVVTVRHPETNYTMVTQWAEKVKGIQVYSTLIELEMHC